MVEKFRRMINYTKETSINLFLSIQSCTYVSQDREGIHIYTSFPKRFCLDAGDAVLRNCLEDNPKSIIHGCKKHRVIRKPERLSRLGEFPVPLSGADAKRADRLWVTAQGEQGGKGRIAPAGCEITLIPVASFVSASLLPLSMANELLFALLSLVNI